MRSTVAVAETRDSTGEGIPDDSRDDLPPIVSDDLLPIVEDDLSPLVSNDRPNDPLSADETVLIADQDDQFEMFEETAVGAEGVAAEQEIPAVDDDPPTPFLPLLENDAPMGRAETYVQELDSYDDLAAEREFASAAVPHAAAPVQADPLEDLLGQLEDEVAVATEAPDELPVLAELEALQEQESAIKAPRLETAEIDELEILEEFGEEASVDVVRSEVPAGLDSALASFGDASVDIDDESDFEIDVTDSV